jgi:diketogulonate reductase-like aldo/keto reductase
VGRESSISLVLHRIAQTRQVPLTSIALAYIMHKTPYVFPILGGRKVSHLKANISALRIALSDAEMEEIEGAYDFDIGFPHNLMSGPKPPKSPGDNLLTQIRGQFDFVEGPRTIKPAL